MEERATFINISRLLSEREYIDLRRILKKRSQLKALETVAAVIAGGTALLVVLYFLAGDSISLYYIPLWCIALPPLYKAFQFLWLFFRKSLDSKFFHSERFKNEAATVMVTPETLEVKTVRSEGKYPLEALYEVVETRYSFIVFVGYLNEVVIPKRLLTEEQAEKLRALFKEKLSGKLTMVK